MQYSSSACLYGLGKADLRNFHALEYIFEKYVDQPI